MYPYRYSVSLRVFHPTMNPDTLTKRLSLQPSRKWMVGEPRSTPKGNKLKGINKGTYWTAELHKEKSLLSRKVALEDFLAEQLATLKKVENYFRHIRKTGGRIELFVGLFCDKNMGAEFPSSLLATMGKLGINLSLDIYPK
jgi:hypothetical protein